MGKKILKVSHESNFQSTFSKSLVPVANQFEVKKLPVRLCVKRKRDDSANIINPVPTVTSQVPAAGDIERGFPALAVQCPDHVTIARESRTIDKKRIKNIKNADSYDIRC